ncbi:MAG TPA: hypothetical protein VGC64_03490, partial [Pyrinomonadaceae bacterium]
MPPKRACDFSIEDRAEIISQTDWGARLGEALITRLAARSLCFDYRRRRFIYRAGEAADALYVIARGR